MSDPGSSACEDFVFIDPSSVPMPRGYKGGSGGGVVRNSDPEMHTSGLVGDNDDEGNA